jgi:hypothetical protein
VGAGAQVDPYAGVGTAVGSPAPNAPSADPYAGIGTPVAPATPPAGSQTQGAAPGALTQNPKGEGTYQMTAVKGGTPIQVPYSSVPLAMQQGYGMDFNGDGQRYMKDRAADPNTSTMGDAAHAVLSIPGDVAHGLKLWLPNPEDLVKGAMKHEAEIPQSVASWFGGDEAKGGMRNLENRILPGSGNPASNTAQRRGENVASVGEYAAGEKMLAKLTEAVVPLAEGTDYAEKLKNAQPIIKAAAAHPRIARVLAAGLSQGVLGGGQAALHGATGSEAALDAAVGSGIGVASEGIPEGIAHLAETRGPVSETIAGETVPSLSSQRPGMGARGSVTVAETPQVRAEQQAAAPRVFRNVAQRATKQALDVANEGRVIPGQITDQARMLPAPSDAKPYAFTIEGPGTTEEDLPGGNEPRKRQIGTRVVPRVDAEGNPMESGQVNRSAKREPVFQYLTSLKPGQEIGSTSVTGGGDLVSADPETAQMHLSRLNDLVDHPPPEATPEQMRDIETARDNLQDQMDMYNAHQRTLPNFSPIDSVRAAASVGHFGEAADQLQNAATPIYQKIDAATDGEFSDLNRARAAAAKRGDFTAKADIEDKMDQLISSSGAITPAERQQATKLWATSKVLDGFNDVINNAANVSDDYASQVSGGRVLSGTKLQNGLQKMINRYGADRLESVVGKDGMENMTRIADLLKVPAKRSAIRELSTSLIHNLANGKMGAGVGALVGHHLMGYEGAVGGAYAGAQAERLALRMIATSPRAGQLFDYAVRNNVTPKVAAGLVAAEIERENEQEQQQPQENQQ